MSDQRPSARAPILKRPIGLQNQPARAEQAVAKDEGKAGHRKERREAVERAASKVAAFGLKALNERAEHDALREGADDRAVIEGAIPEGPMLGVAVAELESDAAEDEREQHDQGSESRRRAG